MTPDFNRILIVDDEQEFAHTIQRHLKRHGFHPDTAGNGKQACRLIENAARVESHYEVVITDVVMPFMNGVELLQWIKKHHPQIPVLVITGYGAKPNIRAALRTGKDSIAKKPLTPDEMLDLINTLMPKPMPDPSTKNSAGLEGKPPQQE